MEIFQLCRSLSINSCFSSCVELELLHSVPGRYSRSATSLTSSAASSDVSPCPRESILTGLTGLSIRSDRLQFSQNGAGPVPSRKHALC